MDKNSPYYKQVALLVRALPYVSEEKVFALKGGTAINLFVQAFPRLSVDIDLAYLPLEPRNQALINVRQALSRIATRMNQAPDLKAQVQDNKPDEMRVIVTGGNAQIKIEVSPVARGVLFQPVMTDIVESVEDEFGFASIQLVSMADLYGGKLCAALDRQHPRDLFDVKMLLESDGINRSLFNGFITYLLSHNRPISEVMQPRWKDISQVYESEFVGMTFTPVSLDALLQARHEVIDALKSQFSQRDFKFLVSFKSGAPDWSLFDHPEIQHLPAVKWKLANIKSIPKEKHTAALKQLQSVMAEWVV